MTSMAPVGAASAAPTGARIIERQDQPDMLDVLRSKSAVYDAAQRSHALEFVAMVGLPLVLVALIAAFPRLTGLDSVYNVAAAAAYISFLRPRQEDLAAVGATLQEWFDCTVFELAWRSERAGPPPLPETIRRWALRHPSRTELRHWYPAAVVRLPIAAAVVVCHRANGTWSSTVRARYARALSGAAWFIVLMIVVVALLRDATFIQVLEWGGAVSAPLLWLFDQCRRQHAVARDAENVRVCADSIWQRMCQGEQSNSFMPEIRELQNDILALRKRAPQLLPWVYGWFRDQDEREMEVVAAELVDQYVAANREPLKSAAPYIVGES